MTDAERALVLLDKIIADLAQLRAQLAGESELSRKLDDLIARGQMLAARPPLYFDTAANHALAKELDAVIRERLDEAIARGRMIAAGMD